MRRMKDWGEALLILLVLIAIVGGAIALEYRKVSRCVSTYHISVVECIVTGGK